MNKTLLAAALLIISSCSTIESLKGSNTQNLLIDTPHVEGAECNISDKMGRKWNVWETPGTTAIQEGHPPLVIICTKNGFKKSVLTINEHKEEILTIDGKRIDLSIYGDFPTKFPRLIPSAIKEVAGFAQDPTGNISTTYPNKIVVWMEPKKWESEEQMREWAFDREIQDRADVISEDDAKLTEEERKEKRRADQKKHNEDFSKFKKRLQNAGKKGVKNTMKALNPEPAVNNLTESSRVLLNPDNVIGKSQSGLQGAGDEVSSSFKKGSKNIGESAVEEGGKIIDAIDPGTAVDFLNERNDVHAKTRASRANKNSNDSTNSINATGDDGGAAAASKRNGNSPQDLYENLNEAPKYYENNNQYDENGKRIGTQ